MVTIVDSYCAFGVPAIRTKLLFTESNLAMHHKALYIAAYLWFHAVAVLLPVPVFSDTSVRAVANTPAEEWIVDQLEAGRIADLRKAFPEEKDRTISGVFLTDLIIKSANLATTRRSGIRILCATVSGRVDLTGAEVPYDVWLIGCKFEDSVDFARSYFSKDLILSNSSFQEANFQRVRVDGGLLLRLTTFTNTANFSFARIDGNLEAQEVQFTGEDQTANFRSLEVRTNANFSDALFLGGAEFADTIAGGHFILKKAFFANSEKLVSFNAIRIGKRVDLQDASFVGPVNFTCSKINDQLNAHGVKFAGQDKSISFEDVLIAGYAGFKRASFAGSARFRGIVVQGSLSFRNASFKKELDLGFATIRGQLILNDAKFTNRKLSVDLQGSNVIGGVGLEKAVFNGSVSFVNARTGNVRIKNTVFTGPVSFQNADVRGQLEGEGCEFKDGASFTGMNVDGLVSFTEGVFHGAANFKGATISGQFIARDCQFHDEEEEANFNRISVRDGAFLSGAVFKGPVNFGFADISVMLDLKEAMFEKQAVFSSSMIRGNAGFLRAVFEGRAEFRNAHVHGDLILEEAQFKGDADLFGMEVEGILNMSRARFSQLTNLGFLRSHKLMYAAQTTFSGPVLMERAMLMDLLITGPKDNTHESPIFNFFGTHIRGMLTIANICVEQLCLSCVRVGGRMLLSHVSVEREADLTDGDFTYIALWKINWPTEPHSVHLNGIQYQNISSGYGKEGRAKLIDMFNRAKYSEDAYAGLEQFFRRSGYSLDADKVLISQKRRERKELLKGFDTIRNYASDITIAYGTSRSRPIMVSLLFIMVGWCVFYRREGMNQLSPSWLSGKYNSLLYSIHLFFPVISFLVLKQWKPKECRRLASTYMWIHLVAGYIFIPVSLVTNYQIIFGILLIK